MTSTADSADPLNATSANNSSDLCRRPQRATPDGVVRTEDRVEYMVPADLLEADSGEAVAHIYVGQQVCCGRALLRRSRRTAGA